MAFIHGTSTPIKKKTNKIIASSDKGGTTSAKPVAKTATKPVAKPQTAEQKAKAAYLKSEQASKKKVVDPTFATRNIPKANYNAPVPAMPYVGKSVPTAPDAAGANRVEPSIIGKFKGVESPYPSAVPKPQPTANGIGFIPQEGYVPPSATNPITAPTTPTVDPNKPISIDNSQILNGQPYGDVKAAQDAQNAQDIADVTDGAVANPTGGTGYTGGSISGGGSTSGGGGSSGGGTATGGVPTATDGASDNEYFDKLKTMEFDYDVSKDKQYLQAASMLENQVTQMMVGRGGLYSSVTQNALSSKLIELQVAYEKLAYQEFKEERSWNLQMASFIENKNATKFNQDMQIAQFKAQREDAAFSKMMQTKQYNLSAANASFARSQARLASQKESTSNQLAMSMVDYQNMAKQKDAMLADWKRLGRSTPEINAFFGLKYNVPIGSPVAVQAINTTTSNMKSMLTGIQTQAREVGAVSAYQASLTGFVSQDIVPAATLADVKKDITVGGTSSQLDNYRYEVSAATSGVNTRSEAQSAITKALNSRDALKAEMGSNYYNLLMDELYSLQSKYNYTQAGTRDS